LLEDVFCVNCSALRQIRWEILLRKFILALANFKWTLVRNANVSNGIRFINAKDPYDKWKDVEK